MQQRETEALELLKSAVHLDPKLKAVAKAEPDFAALRESPAFRKLINGKQ